MSFGKKIGIILTICLLCCCMISTVSADDSYPNGYGKGFIITPPAVTPTFDPFTDKYMKDWVIEEDGEFKLDLWAIYMAVQQPFTNILGQFFYLILYAIALYSIWSRSNNIGLVIVVMCITMGFWYTLFPKDAWWAAIVIIALGMSAILFRTFKRR